MKIIQVVQGAAHYRVRRGPGHGRARHSGKPGRVRPAGHPAAAVTKTGSCGGPRPSIVLVHGAWADSSSCQAVVTWLQRDGYTVYVPPNPLLGLRYDSAFSATSLTPSPAPSSSSAAPTAARSSSTPPPATPTSRH